MCLRVGLSRLVDDSGEMEYVHPYLRSTSITSFSADDFALQYMKACMEIKANFDNYSGEKSGCSFENNEHLDLMCVSHLPLRPRGFIHLPDVIKKKQAIINIINDDAMCFVWSVLAHAHPAAHDPNRVGKYRKYLHELDLRGLGMPVKTTEILRFEQLNRDYSVNVFALDTDEPHDGMVYPYRVSSRFGRRHEVDLLLLREDGNEHYALIESLSRLLGQHGDDRKFYCRRCLTAFGRVDLLETHLHYCNQYTIQRTQMPHPRDAMLSYKDRGHADRQNCVIYLDFECCLVPINGCQQDPERSSTTPVSVDIARAGTRSKLYATWRSILPWWKRTAVWTAWIIYWPT
jgi:hypothetical protein